MRNTDVQVVGSTGYAGQSVGLSLVQPGDDLLGRHLAPPPGRRRRRTSSTAAEIRSSLRVRVRVDAVRVAPRELFDGAAAAVLESEVSATARGVVRLARLGGYARRAATDDSVGRALREGAPPGLWLACRTTVAPPTVVHVRRKDLAAEFGAASGALGVLQVVAGTCWLDDGDGTALATAGDPEDGVSSLLLSTAGESA